MNEACAKKLGIPTSIEYSELSLIRTLGFLFFMFLFYCQYLFY